MSPRRIPLVLCFIVLITSCSRTSERVLETGKDLIDLYQNSGPVLTAVVEGLKPTPTFGISQPIKDYFVFVSSPDCEPITHQGDGIDPFQTIVCRQFDIGVRFDYWISSTTMNEFQKFILESPGTRVTNSTTWYDNENPEETLGMLYEFIDSEGIANIIWTVDNKNLSAWAKRGDNNQEALYNWWAETGAVHR